MEKILPLSGYTRSRFQIFRTVQSTLLREGITMVQGLPFDLMEEIDGNDYQYTLDTLLWEDDDAPMDAETEAERRDRLRRAQEEKERLIEEAKKSMEDLNNFINNLSLDTTTVEVDASSSMIRDRIKHRSEELIKIRNQIKEQSAVASISKMELLESRNKRASMEIKTALKEKAIQEVSQSVLAAEAVDLAFIVDATSSMSTLIDGVKTSIREIVTQVRQTNVNLNLRLAVVAYRDLNCTPEFDVLDFVTGVEQFEAFLGEIKCATVHHAPPDDAPEDMAGGIQKANKLSWSSRTRVAFLIADCPCHGSEFHSLQDNYPGGTPGIDIRNELRALVDKSDGGTMSVFFGRLTAHTDSMIQRFEESGLLLSVVDTRDPKEVIAATTKGVRSSIFKTITASGHEFSLRSSTFNTDQMLKNQSGGIPRRSMKLKSYCVVPRLPSVTEWHSQPAVLVKVYNNAPIVSMEDLKLPLRVGKLQYLRALLTKHNDTGAMETTMVLRRSAAPFAEGSLRIAYHGQLARTEEELLLPKSNVVMKAFKHIGKDLNALKQYLGQMELSNIANFLANEYNKNRRLSCGNVYVLKSCVVEEQEDINEGVGSRRFCAEVPLPSGSTSFTKYCNNTGHWNIDEMHETLLRFTMFTYWATHEYLMVSDLQGVQVGNDFYLTDPVILSTDFLRFGHTNLGETYLKKCVNATKHHLSENGWNL
jgi:Alpha-kinase family